MLRTASLYGWRTKAVYAMVVRDGTAWGIAAYSLQLIVYSLRLISWLFADNLQISCDFLGGYEKSRTFGKLYK